MLPETLEENLRRYGWTYQRLPGAVATSVWRTGFQGEHAAFPMEIRLSETFLTFDVSPLIEWVLDWHEWPELLLEMLEMNEGMKMAKLGIGPCGSLSLSSHIPVGALSYEVVEMSLGVLGHYVEDVTSRLGLLMRELGCCRDRTLLL